MYLHVLIPVYSGIIDKYINSKYKYNKSMCVLSISVQLQFIHFMISTHIWLDILIFPCLPSDENSIYFGDGGSNYSASTGK